MNLDYVVDQSTGIAIVRPFNRMFAPHVRGIGTVTYRCHTCGELIPKHWETFFFDPVSGWSDYLLPPVMPSSMTTHHDWHLAATQEG